MRNDETWRAIVASALDWEQAHARFAKAVDGLAPGLRGKRPAGAPHSVWDLVEHIRLAQNDLLEFCRNPDYHHELKWPEGYWPSSSAPADDAEWSGSLARIESDRDAFAKWAAEAGVDLTEKIPRGTGQTYLRTVLVAVDHASYHVGQIVLVRKLLGAWT